MKLFNQAFGLKTHKNQQKFEFRNFLKDKGVTSNSGEALILMNFGTDHFSGQNITYKSTGFFVR